MRNELTAPSRERLHTKRDVPIDIAIELGKEFVDPRLGPIVGFTERTPNSIETGNVFQYVSKIQETAAFSPNGLEDPDNTGGSAINRDEARIAAIGEAVERYCLSLSDPDDFITSRYDGLDRRAMNPLAMNAFSERQLDGMSLTRDDIRMSEYHWTATREMVSGKMTLVPGQLIYLPFSSPTTVRSPMTTGAAAGMDYESACYRALCEIVERECFIIGYLNKLQFPKIDLSSVEDEGVAAFQKELENRGMDVHVLDISLDHPVHACLAIATDHDRRPGVCLGLDASVDMTTAIRDSLREAFQISTWDAYEQTFDSDTSTIQTLKQRAAYWAPPERVNELDFWLETDERTGLKQPICDRSDALATLETFLEDNGYSWYVADVTTPDIRTQGFKTVSTVIPEFHPLHLIESFKYLGTDRLYSVPVETGYLAEPRTESELNTMPHPFL
ncbi:YcaO-like family protein [Haloarcula brevis]|uniref:YcaO-like family protein n=1 Tax=Haloarcula brevis TaxID=3111453 RepID=UPI00300EBF35